MTANKILKTVFKNKFTLYYLEEDRYIGSNIARCGEYEPYETDLMLSNVRASDIVIDVGANIGFHTVLLADKVGAAGQVLAFEPDPVNYSLLKKNIESNNLSNVKAFNMALGNKQETKDLFLSKDNLGDHRLYSDNTDREKIAVECDTLDNVINKNKGQKRIRLIKIDTQGYEPFVIEGAKNLIHRDKPILFLEYWPYGYRHSGGDAATIFDYLKKEYGEIYFIDEENRCNFPINKKFADNYCEKMEGMMHCNICCKKNYLGKIMGIVRRYIRPASLNDIFINWKEGFYSLETNGSNNWRWCSSQGELAITNMSKKKLMITMEMSLATGHEDYSDLVIEGPSWSETLKINANPINYSKTLVIPPGRIIIKFNSNAPKVDAPQDSRFIVFNVIDFCLKQKTQGRVNVRYDKQNYSQNNEDRIIEEIFRKIGTTNKYFVEFGVGSGAECNTRYLLSHKGWQGLMMDAGENLLPHVHREFITAENVNQLFAKYNVPRKFDLLSIDIDGNDYWIWQALTDYDPRVVIIEYNASIPVNESKVIPYDPQFCWDGTDYFGASLLALVKLDRKKGYTLVGCDSNGINAFFVRDDLIQKHFKNESVDKLYRQARYGIHNQGHPRSPRSEQGYLTV